MGAADVPPATVGPDVRAAPGVALVTGSSGAIGSATVAALVALGYRTVGFDRVPSSDGATDRVVELSDADAVAEAVDRVRGTGRLMHVISIAGGAVPGEPDTQRDPVRVDPALFRASIEQNLTSQFLLLRAVLPWMREGPPGDDRSIAFTSSFNALSAQGMPGYSAAKAGLIGLMHGLVDPLGAEGIRVNVVAPGTIRTPRTEKLYGGVPGHFERLERGTALGRLGSPADVAAVFASLTHLRHVTGQVLVVDGGQMTIHR